MFLRHQIQFSPRTIISLLGYVLSTVLMQVMVWAEEPVFSKSVVSFANEKGLNIEGAHALVNDAKYGKVVRLDSACNARYDLKAMGLDVWKYDLLKVEVKSDRAGFLRFSLENYPAPGDLSHWYVLDALRGPFDWRTIWIDLKNPEEIKKAGAYKGMKHRDDSQRGLLMQSYVKDTRRVAQGSSRKIWISDLRIVKKSIHLDWDQRQAPYEWKTGGDLVFKYPLTVSNLLDRKVTAAISLKDFEVKHAQAELSQSRIMLDAKETKTITATVRLDGKFAAKQEPLYCERFLVLAKCQGIEDSEVTILRSADPLHLTVTVPIAEEKLQHPIFPVPTELPESILRFESECAKTAAAGDIEQILIETRSKHLRDTNYCKALMSNGYLHAFTGKPEYLERATRLLMGLPDSWKHRYEKWSADKVKLISSGVITHATLSLGWRFGGTQRSPYNYGGCKGNDQLGRMGSITQVYDFLAPNFSAEQRKRFVHELLLPAAIQCRNHYIGDGNQQATANLTTLMGGLMARNWPLVSFAYSSEHGIHGIINWTFGDDGRHLRNKYQTYTLRPILWTAELLYALGIDIYSIHRERLQRAVYYTGGMSFEDRYFWDFVVKHRLNKKVALGGS